MLDLSKLFLKNKIEKQCTRSLCDNICQTKSLAGHLAKLVDIYLEMGSFCICKATSFTPSQLSPLYALCLFLFYSNVFVIKFLHLWTLLPFSIIQTKIHFTYPYPKTFYFAEWIEKTSKSYIKWWMNSCLVFLTQWLSIASLIFKSRTELIRPSLADSI